MTFAHPFGGHPVQMLEEIEAKDFIAARVRPRPGHDLKIVHDINVQRVLGAIVVDIARRRRLAATEFEFHVWAPLGHADIAVTRRSCEPLTDTGRLAVSRHELFQ